MTTTTTTTRNPPPTPLPAYIYKILPLDTFPSPSSTTTTAPITPPHPLPPALPLSPLDAGDGFIHLSTSGQLLGTLGRFFAAVGGVWMARCEYAAVERWVRWDGVVGEWEGEGEGVWKTHSNPNIFPHIYANGADGVGERGLKFGRDEIESVRLFQRSEGGEWTAEGWPWEEDVPVA